VLAVDEHGVVPLGHAQEHDDPIPPAAHTELTAVIELIGDLKDTAVSVFRVIIYKSKINAAILLLGNSFGPSLQLFPLLITLSAFSVLMHLMISALRSDRRLVSSLLMNTFGNT